MDLSIPSLIHSFQPNQTEPKESVLDKLWDINVKTVILLLKTSALNHALVLECNNIMSCVIIKDITLLSSYSVYDIILFLFVGTTMMMTMTIIIFYSSFSFCIFSILFRNFSDHMNVVLQN